MSEHFIVDGSKVFFREGQTVLQAAREQGIQIPTLCYHRKTGPAGRCRACVVEVEGRGRLTTSCDLPARAGMVVHSNTERVLATRRMVVRMMLANGEHNCLSCEQNGACELQDAAYQLGIETPTFPGAVFPGAGLAPAEAVEGVEGDVAPAGLSVAVDDSGEMILVDRRKCIACGRCVVACNDVVVNEALGMSERGGGSRIAFDLDRLMANSSCVQCGECVQLCPVGALIDRKAVGKGRTWQLEKIDTTCAYCGVGCQVTLHVDRAANRIVRVTGRETEPNDGMLCVKGRYGYEFPSSENRLTEPMIRKNGELEPVSWDEALDYTAARIGEIVEEYGPDSFSAFGSGRVTNENNYAISKFTRAVIKTNNVDHCART
jgi:predicted molibdopterin-dependent oxidoreductase YjgC